MLKFTRIFSFFMTALALSILLANLTLSHQVSYFVILSLICWRLVANVAIAIFFEILSALLNFYSVLFNRTIDDKK